jgi:hypothetical protein
MARNTGQEGIPFILNKNILFRGLKIVLESDMATFSENFFRRKDRASPKINK